MKKISISPRKCNRYIYMLKTAISHPRLIDEPGNAGPGSCSVWQPDAVRRPPKRLFWWPGKCPLILACLDDEACRESDPSHRQGQHEVDLLILLQCFHRHCYCLPGETSWFLQHRKDIRPDPLRMRLCYRLLFQIGRLQTITRFESATGFSVRSYHAV